MWQIMWMLNLLPDFVWHLLLIISLVTIAFTYFLRMIPFVGANSVQLRFAAIALLVLAVWMEGGIANEAKWKERVRELEAKVAQAEKESAEANSKVQTVYVDRVKTVKEIQYITVNKIAKDAAKIDKTCVIDPEVITILNNAAHTGAKK